LNPKANGGRAASRWQAVLADPRARKLGLAELPVYDGLNPGPWMEEQLQQGRSHFVACGGDGTVNLAVTAICESDLLSKGARLGAIGLGSSNDFHKPYGLAGRERIAGRPARLSFEHAAPHDVGQAVFPDATRYFAINASVGVTAEANDLFNRGPEPISLLKRRWVDGAIVASALLTFARYRNLELEVAVDAGRKRALLLTNLGVIKNRHFSGSFRYESGPAPDDGQLGVHVCEGMGRAEMLRTLASLARGRFTRTGKTSSASARAAEVTSPAGKPFAVETDGEITHATSARFEVLSRRIFLCP
jgi:diacylglycerol kinase family enzyme